MPTPTPLAKSKNKPPKRWEILWTKSCERGSNEENGWNFLPGDIQPFPFISACGSRCGSRQKTDKSAPNHVKRDNEKISALSRKICRAQTTHKLGHTVLGHCKIPSNSLNKKQRNRTTMRFLTSLVGESGFEPLKSSTTDLQSAPFGHSGTPP